MFGFSRREREPEPIPVIDRRWQKATWDGIDGYARITEDDDDYWDFSITLPEDTEPNSVNLGCSEDTESEDYVFTVSYRPKDMLFWKLIKVPEVTEIGNILVNFSAHIGDHFRQISVFREVNNSTEVFEL